MAINTVPRKELLARKHEQALVRRIVLIAIVCLTLVLLFIYFAIPAMVKIADVWETTRNASKPGVESSSLDIPLDPPQFNALPTDATNTPSVTVSGRAQAGLAVHLKFNGKDVQNIVADNSGNFTFGDMKLSEGKNTFIAYVQDSRGRKSVDSGSLSIILDTKAPRVQITSPSDGQVFGSGQQIISVSGKADEATQMYVNGSLAILKSDGSFDTRVFLQPGENTITMYATDDAGNKSVDVARKVTYNP
jgi:bacillopeptidase F